MSTVGGLILTAILLILLGLVLRSDLVALVVDAIGVAFIAIGVLVGFGGMVRLFARART